MRYLIKICPFGHQDDTLEREVERDDLLAAIDSAVRWVRLEDHINPDATVYRGMWLVYEVHESQLWNPIAVGHEPRLARR